MAVKPSIPKGTRDFSPSEVTRRKYIVDVFRKLFESFGYQPIETPSFENIETLTGKYGEEGDRLIFKILRSGDFMEKVPEALRLAPSEEGLKNYIADKALRYDLTVPFARYVVQHRNDLHFPFKRYQIQPVWRADRPQKGRYREFWQCDVDSIGSPSLWQEVELIQIYDRAFEQLKLPVVIHMNNRKVLAGIAEVTGASEYWTAFTVVIDKLDKIGLDKVLEELITIGMPHSAVESLRSILIWQEDGEKALNDLQNFLAGSKTGLEGLEEMRFVWEKAHSIGLKRAQLTIDPTLARGLDYYTGAIFEVKASEAAGGSIGGGGRYDDLTGIFGLNGMSGVGVSFGLDRIYLCLEQLGLFPTTLARTSDVLFFNMGEEEMIRANTLAAGLREKGLSVECYPDNAKFKKQFDYAEKKNIPFAVILGEAELKEKVVQLKDLNTGDQRTVKMSDLYAELLELMK